MKNEFFWCATSACNPLNKNELDGSNLHYGYILCVESFVRLGTMKCTQSISPLLQTRNKQSALLLSTLFNIIFPSL